MKVFIWQRVSQCSANYHAEGGVAVFASSLERAIELASKQECLIRENETPDSIVSVEDTAEMVFIFPDAGCC